ncbi:UDP-4-amino-4,6-dideoxy-N-acetyl-beta-L-altrosamine N-acetyltransferase [Pseudomonas saliphila]|uniref:UDP-4-amino-4, 6-dideoxy-N-acetyl-beta-L-altrosamine N-acetyltransferase n=1 Tax=Pseudomonas saliphila TaxID=2586906 RepID=UPI001238656D|nr:UDP-4-amino-4,6-dideoxy-N-acetyl-beta-L-altrosamine N-acetyltransferase [Pseudomonas saliphila]
MTAFGVIRNIDDSELELMLAWRNAPAARQNMYTRHEISLAEHLSWWARTQSDARHRYFMYELDSVPLGIVGFNHIDEVNRNSSWAFYAAPDAPRGTGSKMEYLALNYAFDQLGLRKLQCEVLAFNEAVIKLHQKFGFTVEGVLREQHRIDGRFVDVYRLGLLAPEWAGHREAMHSKLAKIVKAKV